MKRLLKYLALTRADRKLLRNAVYRLLLARAALRVLPFSLVLRTLDKPGVSATVVTPELTRRIAATVKTAARSSPITLNCLPQALAVCWLLQKYGAAPRLHYGVESDGRLSFRAHAWVELDGRGIIGHDIPGNFATLATFPDMQNS
jgi:hypothetical protein